VKLKELRELSVSELERNLKETREKLFKLKFQHSSTPLKNPLVLRMMRKEIARIKTLIMEHSMKKNA